MPMRVMGYDYGSYKKQYDSNAVKYKTEKGLSDDEFISKMKKTDKFIPIITIVIYYGEKAWDGAVSLQGMLDIPEDMKAFINDYKMNLVEARKNNLKLHNINNKDLFNHIIIYLAINCTCHSHYNGLFYFMLCCIIYCFFFNFIQITISVQKNSKKIEQILIIDIL